MDRTPSDIVDRCVALARSRGLAVLLDLDGTLVPFADTPEEADLDDDVAGLLRSLLATGAGVAVVSGRLRRDVERVQGRVPGAWWVAEHGAWHCDEGGWKHIGVDHPELDTLTERLGGLATGCVGARLERKSASVCLHWRRVPDVDRAELIDLAEQTIDEWLEANPSHERLGGVDMIEVRARDHHKGSAVAWIRGHGRMGRMIAVGDDVTDEDMFRALDPDDLAIVVGRPGDRASGAHLSVEDVAGVRRFLRWLVEARADPSRPISAPPVHALAPVDTPVARTALLVISNRTPQVIADPRQREVGGLVAALGPALREHQGMWLGWSGQQREGTVALRVDRDASPIRACFDLSTRQRRLFYSGFCNRSLWPMLHGLPGRVRYEDDEWTEYVAANEIYARVASELAAPTGVVWVHDYHLLLVARSLRRRGHVGPIGHFLHVPFPARDVVDTMPWAREVVEAMLASDLIGFHTGEWAANFVAAARGLLGARWDGRRILHGGTATTVGAYPIAIDASGFCADVDQPQAPDVEGLRAMLGDRKLLLGVDRLDYSKGIPERLEAFERLLESFPTWRGRVIFVQVSVPSRADVPEYAELKARVEHLVGRINGRFGEANWVPVRYLYRSYGHDVLAQLYRLADVAVVTPLRDGMNLVAKEFVAAQEDSRPGVLVLSRFAGAAEELHTAILTNPFHRDGLAADLDHALAMPIEERRDRQRRLRQAVARTTPVGWATAFLGALAATRDHVTGRGTAR
jgi:trehalose 6-phosphate synthase